MKTLVQIEGGYAEEDNENLVDPFAINSKKTFIKKCNGDTYEIPS